ncbi:MFS transporter [Nocardioides sp. HDW12B]|uniref:MFS transporter n=1 Tax=Nocardioides sp. HDW12B TaxID=2714939 RepID=UPI001F0ECD93|nr:MFS transporter [Nocardioides sp. HDW12B]
MATTRRDRGAPGVPGAGPVGRTPSSWAHLRRLLRGRWFRRLLGVRLASQLSDGVLQVALTSYALFGQDQTDPAEIAVALAVVLLPFSLLGPFVGVFLDRWSRRQVLVVANLVRVVIAAVLAGIVAADLPDAVFYLVVLVCLSVNRFLLAGLSAGLPHTVSGDDLLTANALTPTAGTMAFLAGLGVGGLVTGLTGAGDVGVLLLAALLYGVAGSLALRIPRTLLGPDRPGTAGTAGTGLPGDHPDAAAADLPSVGAALRAVGLGLVDGLRHLRSRRDPATGLALIAGQRYLFGLTAVLLLLYFRNGLHPDDPDAAFAALGRTTLAGGAGFLSAALLTPVVTERVRPHRWIVLLLAGAAAVQLLPAVRLTEPTLLVASFGVGLAAQGIKICVDTFVQRDVDDAFRGRVFSLYDVLFNVAFVSAAVSAVVLLPRDGRAPVALATVAACYLVLAVVFARVTRQRPDVPGPVSR